ncbi:putative metal-binding motif-containing protein [Myxococcus sp. AM011]|nr:putative metal-binding motif-containing protein [Myxococcus sp. AM011]
MRRLLLFALPLLAVACSKKDQANIAINVNYTPSFKTGCIVMQVQDEANAANVTDKQTVTDLATRVPPLKLGVALREGWGPKLKVTIAAHEQSCEGKEVDKVELSVDLSGEGTKSAVSAQLNAPDEDGDGYVAVLGDGKGGTDCQDSGLNAALRFPGNIEVCDAVDNNCSGVADEGLDKKWYQDADNDGVPRGPDFVSQCAKPAGNYIEYAEAGPFDCDETSMNAANRFPGNEELCDGFDNNCENGVDEGFAARNAPCNNECGGVTVCAADGKSVVCNREPGRNYYRDVDGDEDGDATLQAVVKCQGQQPDPGYVLNNHGDCDDVDPAVSSLRAEVCDAIDNNCDGTVDNNTAVSCGGTLKDVADYHLSSTGQNWRTVSAAPSGYPVWVAGLGGKLAMRRAAGAKFESFSFGDPTSPTPPDGSPVLHPNNCGNGDWYVSWVNSSGVVFLGGPSGLLAIHTGATDYTCVPGGAPTSVLITGMVGFDVGGMTTIYITDSDGRLIRWNVGSTPAFTDLNDNNFNYYGLHGLSEDLLLVSGGRTGPDQQRFASYAGVSSGTTAAPTTHTANPNNVGGKANAVWMGTASNACAVGDGGAVWRWDGATTWNRFNAPAGVTVDFSSVVMRYNAQDTANPLNRQCYMVDKSAAGKLRRLTPFGWAKGPDLPLANADKPLRDIAITQTTGEFWIVGDDGRVFHYPEPAP